MKRKCLIRMLYLLLLAILMCKLTDCSRKEKRVERAILLGYLLGSSTTNNQHQQTYYPQYPIFMPAHGMG